MKYQELKAQLIKQSAVTAAVLVVLAGSVFALGLFSDSYGEKNNKLKNEVNGITSDATKLQEKYNKIQQNMNLYQEAIAKNNAGKLSINHQSVRDTFNQLNDKYYLSNLHLTMSGIDEVKSASFKHNSAAIVSSEVTVNFQAISDEQVYGMLDQMQRDLSGTARLTKLTLTRTGAISDTVLQAIVQQGTYPLVTGEMKFLWFGVKPTDSKPVGTDIMKQTQ